MSFSLASYTALQLHSTVPKAAIGYRDRAPEVGSQLGKRFASLRPRHTRKPKLEPINNENWKQHPDIKDIRTLVSGYLSPASKVEVMSHTFNDMCGEKGIVEVGLAYPGEGEPLAYFLLIEAMGDVGRETKVFYDSKGDARFVMSEYTHSSAESIYVSRAYYKNRGLIFSPQPEQTSEKSGPTDDKKAQDLFATMVRQGCQTLDVSKIE